MRALPSRRKSGPRSCFGGEQCAQPIGPAAGLQQHRGVHAVEGGGLGDCGLGGGGRKAAAASSGLRFRGFAGCREQFELAGREWRPLDAVGKARGALVTEKLTRPLRDRQQADDALLGLDDPVLPGIKMDAERLREAAHDVVDQREAFCGFAAAAVFFGLRVVGLLFGVTGRFRVGAIARGRAKGP